MQQHTTASVHATRTPAAADPASVGADIPMQPHARAERGTTHGPRGQGSGTIGAVARGRDT
eukprot:1072375-Prymnesium_polylepis.1